MNFLKKSIQYTCVCKLYSMSRCSFRLDNKWDRQNSIVQPRWKDISVIRIIFFIHNFHSTLCPNNTHVQSPSTITFFCSSCKRYSSSSLLIFFTFFSIYICNAFFSLSRDNSNLFEGFIRDHSVQARKFNGQNDALMSLICCSKMSKKRIYYNLYDGNGKMFKT